MRFARLATSQGPIHVRLEGDRAEPLTAPPWGGGEPSGPPLPWSPADLLCPVTPSKIVCIGRNYVAHAKELGNEAPAEPLLFMKPPSSLVGPGGVVVLPGASTRVEHEAELGVVIGRRARSVSRDQALGAVFGYTAVNDVTARDLQKRDGQWTRAKGFDTFCPAGPWIDTGLDPRATHVRCRVNGTTRQDGTTANMVHDVAALVAYVSSVMTLEPGDLIATGTPEGVGPLVPGDVCEVEIAGQGEPLVLRVDVRGA